MRHTWVGSAVWSFVCFSVFAAMCAPIVVGADHSVADTKADLASLVNDDTFAVAQVNLAVSATDDNWIAGPLVRQLPQLLGADAAGMAALATIGSLKSAGAERAFVALGLGDLYLNGGPLVVVTSDLDHPPSGIEAVLQRLSNEIAATNPAFPKFSVRRHGSRSVLFGSARTVARYETIKAGERDDLVEPLEKLSAEGATVAAVFSPGNDFRRVVRELWPQFPEPLTTWKGELADCWLRLEFAAQLQGAPSAKLVLQATDAASAELFAQLLRALPGATGQLGQADNKRHKLLQYLQAIVDAVPPEVEGTRVVMQLPTDASRVAKLQELVNEAKDAALESTRRNQRMQQFKQIALAIHNYADRNKHLPPPSIRGKNGKPLLSWRVAILPWIEQKNLYDQFHLNEPWDSPHNLALAKVLPSVYGDATRPELARAGKTTYVAPVGPGTIFDTKDGIAFRDIKDGTSNTIMLVEVPPEAAVVWTKPADWEVDMDHPVRGLERTDREHFTTAWCDGSARIIPTDMKPDMFRAILTRAGGETVDLP